MHYRLAGMKNCNVCKLCLYVQQVNFTILISLNLYITRALNWGPFDFNWFETDLVNFSEMASKCTAIVTDMHLF